MSIYILLNVPGIDEHILLTVLGIDEHILLTVLGIDEHIYTSNYSRSLRSDTSSLLQLDANLIEGEP